MTFEQMMRAMSIFLGSALTVAEVNPDHDPGLVMTARLTGELVEMLAVRGATGTL